MHAEEGRFGRDHRAPRRMPQPSAQIHASGWDRRRSPGRAQAVPSCRAVDVSHPQDGPGAAGLRERKRGCRGWHVGTRATLDRGRTPEARVAASGDPQQRSRRTHVLGRPLSGHRSGRGKGLDIYARVPSEEDDGGRGRGLRGRERPALLGEQREWRRRPPGLSRSRLRLGSRMGGGEAALAWQKQRMRNLP